MHEFKGEYKENDCIVKIATLDESYLKNPYMVLNLERYFNANGWNNLSHCDFVYVFFRDDKYEILFVELKDLEEIKKEDLKEILDDAVNNKFPQTLSIMDDLGKFLNIRRAKYYGVLVLPPIGRILALIPRFHSKFTVLKKVKKGKIWKFDDAWIAPCGKSIWSRYSQK